MPILFIGHGSPMNIVLKNDFTDTLHQWGKALPTPKAVLIISAHWLSRSTKVACTEKPKTIYDFYGFPKELYTIKYECPGSPEVANRIVETINRIPIECDLNWGLDHGAWSVMHHLYPNAQIPTFQMSIDYDFSGYVNKPLKYHYELGKELAFLREQGVLIIGSGNIVHNLYLIDFNDIDAKVHDWALEFDDFVKKALERKEHYKLLEFQQFGKPAMLSVPTWDHYLPLIYVVAMQEEFETCKFIHEGFQYGSVSMRAFQIDNMN